MKIEDDECISLMESINDNLKEIVEKTWSDYKKSQGKD